MISGNRGSGVGIHVGPPYDIACGCWAGSTRNKVVGNYIGVDASGTLALGNGADGITIASDGNIVGGAMASDRNIISGNSFSDVHGAGSRNKVIGNFIGTDARGLTNLSNTNYWSVGFECCSSSNIIEANVITGGPWAGIALVDPGTSYNEVIGNFLGLDANGSVVLSGGDVGTDQPFNRIGGKTPRERNVITGTISLVSRASDSVVIGNYVGTDATASRAVGGGAIGVRVQGNHNLVGGSTEEERNVVAGQIALTAGASQNLVAGNSVGTNAAGTISLIGTYFNGIALDAAEHNAVQGNSTFGPYDGIRLSNGANFNWLRSNRIARSDQFGIEIAQSDDNRVEGNALLNNRTNGGDSGRNNRWDDGRHGNYWSDYTGHDADGDGIGDTPYAVPANGADRFPLTSDPLGSGSSEPSFQGLWWNAPAGTESGWGINFAHQGDIIFATWFTYDATGKPWWLTAVLSRTADGVYAGPVSTVAGPLFNSVPFGPTPVETEVGTMTASFSDATHGSLTYTVNGIAQIKSIVP